MGRFLKASCIASVLLATALASCSPKATPTHPVPATSASSTVAPQPKPPVSADDAAWAKVVDAAKKEGQLTAYAYTWTGDIGLAISRAFKDKYGISVNIVTGRGAEFTERLKTEKRVGQIMADMTEGSITFVQTMKGEGLLANAAEGLPVLKEKGVWLADPVVVDPRDKMNLTWRLLTYTPYVNTKLVKPEDQPHSWKDLLDPRWKGKLGIPDPNTTPNIYHYIVVFQENKVWDDAYIKALGQQKITFSVGPADEVLKLSRGEIALAVVEGDTTTGYYALQGSPIQAIDMKEGIVVTTASVAAIAGGPNPHASRVFLNWLFSAEGQSVAGKAQGNKMVRSDVPDFRAEGARTDVSKPLVESLDNLDKATQMYQQKWYDKTVGR